MNSRSVKWFMLMLSMYTLGLAGDLRINVVNGTRNAPGSADRVALIDLAAGMAEVAGENDITSSVTFSNVAASGQGQYLVRATVGGVTYSSMFVPTPGVSAWETSITVYDASQTVTALKASVPFFVIYGFEDKLKIQKRTILENMSTPPVTYEDQPGIARIFIPDDIVSLDNLTFKSGSMPLRTSTIDVADGKVLPNPLKPGLSEIDAEYSLNYDPSGTPYTEVLPYDIEHYHVYVMPMDLKVSAAGLVREGTDTDNGLAIYAMENLKAGHRIEFTISGAGMSDSGHSPDDGHNHEQTTGRIVIENRLDTSVELALAGALVLVVLISLFVSITQQNEDLKQDSVKMLRQQRTALLKQYAKLGKQDSEEKDQILYRLVSVYKTLDRIK